VTFEPGKPTDPEDRVYWVDPGRLMAGDYPGEYDRRLAQSRIDSLVRGGIRVFVNLVQSHEEHLEERPESGYKALVDTASARFGVECECVRHSIHDMSVPEPEQMRAIERSIDTAVEASRPVYVHCWRGRGRTGLVVGVYLVRRGLATADTFVDVIAQLRGRDPVRNPSPETAEQIRFVQEWAETPWRV